MLKRMMLTLLATATLGASQGVAAYEIDAAAVMSRAGEPVKAHFTRVVTGRDWNCKGCYK